MTTPKNQMNYKMGGVSIISGTLTSVSGAFPTFAIHFIVLSL
nr:MAG TPA: Alpha-galactosyl-binding fungal lectin [Caudoviricetes sp.]